MVAIGTVVLLPHLLKQYFGDTTNNVILKPKPFMSNSSSESFCGYVKFFGVSVKCDEKKGR
jgi:hypothetical protein